MQQNLCFLSLCVWACFVLHKIVFFRLPAILNPTRLLAFPVSPGSSSCPLSPPPCREHSVCTARFAVVSYHVALSSCFLTCAPLVCLLDWCAPCTISRLRTQKLKRWCMVWTLDCWDAQNRDVCCCMWQDENLPRSAPQSSVIYAADVLRAKRGKTLSQPQKQCTGSRKLREHEAPLEVSGVPKT